MKTTPFWIIDAFVGEVEGRQLRGNPAAVVLLDEFACDEELLERANEFNLSETAFVVPRGQKEFDLRWMTPQTEVALCGHATLATVGSLLDAGQLEVGQEARFTTKSGILTAQVEVDRIVLDFPSQNVSAHAAPSKLRAALGLGANEVLYCGRSGEDWIVQVALERLELLNPDFKKLAQVEARGVIVTAHAPNGGSGYDFASRFFGPRVGVDEDPVTGSAHTSLTPFWGARLGKHQLKAVQLSSRGGWLEVEVRGLRVSIAGRTALRARGHLC